MKFPQVLFFVTVLFIMSNCKPNDQKTILVFSKTNGFRHSSIPTGVKCFEQLAADNSWNIIISEDSKILNKTALDSIDLIVFLNTTGNILDTFQKDNFRNYIEKGNPFLGIHAASDTEHEWPWYHELIGAYFESHPELQNAHVYACANHLSTYKLDPNWNPFDEWYDFKEIKNHIKPILKLDQDSYKGSKLGENHPIAWTHSALGGEMIYLGMGHTEAIYSDQNFILILEQSVQFLLDEKIEN